MTRRSMPRRGRGTLHIVAFLLVSSAVVRIGAGPLPAAANADGAATTPMTEVSGAGDDIDSMVSAFQAREARIVEREEQLRARMAALREAEAEIDAKMAALVAAEETLSATIASVDQAAETDVSQLTTVYENMKPKEAAALFAEMPPQFAAGFLGLMRPDAAAAIMTELEPDVAYAFSVVLAGRNANAPTE